LFRLQPGDCSTDDIKFTTEKNGVKALYPSDGSCALNTLQIPGKPGVYEALQFHLHTSSEHTIGGSFFGAELHVVHRLRSATETRFAVVGMIIRPVSPTTNPVFEPLLTNLDKYHGDVMKACGGSASSGASADTAFDIYSLLDPNTGYYHYDGGLTTPPCSEIVWWNLADTTVNVSVMQFNRFVNLVVGAVDKETCELKTVADPNTYSTSRPPVDLGDRILHRVCPASSAQ